jgi:hypothetical protein
MAELVDNVGAQFDPTVAAALIPIVAAEASLAPTEVEALEPARTAADPAAIPSGTAGPVATLAGS